MSSIERSMSQNGVAFSSDEGLILDPSKIFSVNKNYINILRRLSVDGCYHNSVFYSEKIKDKSKYYFVRGYSGASNSFTSGGTSLTIELEGPNAESLIRKTSLYFSSSVTIVSSTKIRLSIFSPIILEDQIFESHNEEFVLEKETFEAEFFKIFSSMNSLVLAIINFNGIRERAERACSLECGRAVVSVPQNGNSNLSGVYDISVWTSGTQLKEIKHRDRFDLPYFGDLSREVQKQITEKHLLKDGRPLLHNFKIIDAVSGVRTHSLTIDYVVDNSVYCQCANFDNDGELLVKNYYQLSGTKSVTNLTTSAVTITAITPTGFFVKCVTDFNNINISI